MSSTNRIEHLLVTGANGYIGSHLVKMALNQQRAVTILGKSDRIRAPAIRYLRWELGADLPDLDLGSKRTALLHLAHDWSDRDQHGVNFRGTRMLVSSADRLGIERFVFASSVSARADALNAYGRIKWTIEQLLESPNTVAAKIGLVYGGAALGMYGLLLKLVSSTPVLPMIDPWRLVQPIHVDEVCRGLLSLADGESSGWKGLAGPVPITFAEFLQTLARETRAASLIVPSVPLGLALFGADVASRLPVGPKVDRERILGLAGTQQLDCKSDLESLGLSVLPVSSGLRRDPVSTKALLREGAVLLRYVLRRRAGGKLMRDYVRAIRDVEKDQPGPLALPRLTLWMPSLMRLWEPLRSDGPLATRLRIATALAEWSAEAGSIGDMNHAGWRGRSFRLFSIVFQVILDIIVRPLRWRVRDDSH